ncbi:MAG: protein kinase [Myxococcales bacterium]|nr:protein kinase [Myxococcales bacterium]
MANPVMPPGAYQDRYEVQEFLSEGGMGAIYRGVKRGAGGFDRPVVLKQLLPEYTEQPEFIDLFLREAKLTAGLDHANIVQTIDLVNAGREYFIVMEYVAGADVRTLLKKAKRRRSRLSVGASLQIAREVLSALAYAHDKRDPEGKPLGIIHRDISPSNILVSASGEVKVTDFGIAKAASHNSVFYRVKGKIGYMSPEQARSAPIDRRSDLYAVAVCLYEMLAGEKLFVNTALTASVDDMYAQPIPLVSRKASGLPADLDKLMLKALSLDPDARFQTASEFQEALLKVAHRHGFMMSASDLAPHLEVVCGPAGKWRDLNDNGDLPEKTAAHQSGTDLYAFADRDDDDDRVLQTDSALIAARPPPRREGNPFAGVELTSLLPSDSAKAPPRGRVSAPPPIPAGASFPIGEDTGILIAPPAASSGGSRGDAASSDGGRHEPSPKGPNPRTTAPPPNSASASGAPRGEPSRSLAGVSHSMMTGAVVVRRSIATRLASAPRWALALLVAALFLAIAAAIGFSGPSFDVQIPTLPKAP